MTIDQLLEAVVISDVVFAVNRGQVERVWITAFDKAHDSNVRAQLADNIGFAAPMIMSIDVFLLLEPDFVEVILEVPK